MPLPPRDVGPPSDLPRNIGFWGGSAIMVGVIIGSGIFRAPPELAKLIGNPGVILLLWAAGGVLALFGAMTYAELATLFPRSGGIYVFLREGFGRPLAFVFGWTYMLITKPAAAGGIAIVFGEHVNTLLGTHWDPRIVTIAALLLLTLINTVRTWVGAGVALVLTALKVLALVAIVVLALLVTHTVAASLPAATVSGPLLLVLAPAMAKIMWTYDGWSDVGAIAGEVRDPQRLLPRIYLCGTVLTVGLYLAVNAVYMWIVPLEEMRGVDTVAPLVMQRLIGESGSLVVTLLVIISTLGAAHSSIITGARVTFAQARDGLLFAFLGRVHPVYATPAVALWVQALLSCVATWYCGTFARLADTFIFTMWIFYGLAGAAMILLRIRRPDLQRTYRCWGYPLVPGLFVLAAIAMTVLSIRESPADTLPWLAVLLIGWPAYYMWRWLKPTPAT